MWGASKGEVLGFKSFELLGLQNLKGKQVLCTAAVPAISPTRSSKSGLESFCLVRGAVWHKVAALLKRRPRRLQATRGSRP